MTTVDLNTKVMIQERVASGLVNWKWPLLLVFTRLILALVAQSLVALVFFHSEPSPYLAAGKWWPVYGVLIDLGCFLLVTWLAGKEGLHFRDLINFDSHRLERDILRGLLYILWVFPLTMVGILGFGMLLYGSPQPPSVYSPLPVWATIYSLVFFSGLLGDHGTMHLPGFCFAAPGGVAEEYQPGSCHRCLRVGHPTHRPAADV